MNKVYRCYTEKRPGFDVEATRLTAELRHNLGISELSGMRIFNRYDIEGISDADYEIARVSIFSEPQCDNCYDEALPKIDGVFKILAVESLPGQFDQRADSCAQCVQIMTCGTRPLVRTARIYFLFGEISASDVLKIKTHLMNPVESREATSDKPKTLAEVFDAPKMVVTLDGFTAMKDADLAEFQGDYGLAMDEGDLKLLRDYFRDEEKRDPTITEVRMVDTYWSDHCRHTTFGTHIENAEISDARVKRAYDK
ncbi:MAG: phosphoribosylformylglycinamidine synthase, partial [Clostridia bacterium]